MGIPGFGGTSTTENPLGWDRDDLNPDVPEEGVELTRTTLWLIDDLEFLCKRYYVCGQHQSKEIIDLSKYPEEKWPIYEKTARDFYFKVFAPNDNPDDPDEPSSSDSDWDSTDDDFDPISTETDLLDSTTDFKEDEEEMKRIISFFAKMPKVTKLVQGMLDMMGALTRILPLVIMKVDDPNLKKALERTINILGIGITKTLKICGYLGIKVQRKQGDAINQIVKNRFNKNKNKQDFLEYEIDELNKYLEQLGQVDDGKGDDEDDEDGKHIKGQIPVIVKQSDLYPQKMPLRPHGPQPDHAIVVPVKDGRIVDKEGKPLPPPPPKIKWITDEDGKKKKREPDGEWNT